MTRRRDRRQPELTGGPLSFDADRIFDAALLLDLSRYLGTISFDVSAS